MMARSDYEDQLTFATAEYLDLKGWLYTHFPAGEHRHARVGAKLKRMGLKRGVSDFLIFEDWEDAWSDGRDFVGVDRGHGVAIELKSEKGRLTKDQKRWIGELRHRGWACFVCRTIDEVIEACRVLG
jgi:hypothetical protein